MRVGMGYTYGGHELSDGKFYWWIKLHGRRLADGTSETKREAEIAFKKMLAEVVVTTTKKSHDRSRLQMTMMRYMKSRPYVVAHVLEGLTNNVPLSDITALAEERERELHDREEKQVGYAHPISTHHSARPALEVAQKVYETAQLLGLEDKKAFAYGKKYLGPAWVEVVTGQEDVEAMEEQAEAAAREDEQAGVPKRRANGRLREA